MRPSSLYHKIHFFILFLLIFLLPSFSPVASAVPAMPQWRLDADRTAMPIHFRKDDVLKTAGSGQPSKRILAHLPELLGSGSAPIWIIDLRQESHGYLNEDAVSWHGPGNAANRGMTAAAVEQDERKRLDEAMGTATQAVPMGAYDEKHIPYAFDAIVTEWSTERHLAQENGLGYVRIAATDMQWPEPQAIDDFVAFYRSLPREHGWLYFHCQAGQGRTTTFMALYELLEHPGCTADEAIDHQRRIGGADLRTGERYEGICRFAEYVQENRATDFAQSWSDWLKSQATQRPAA